MANAWIVNEPLEKADAVVVLGGAVETRAFEAARLYREGFAPKVLLLDVKRNPAANLGLVPPESDVTRQLLLKHGVTNSDCLSVGQAVASTHDESCAVRAWVEATGAQRVIIPTDLFHTRRVRWVFRKALKGTGATVTVRAVPPTGYMYSATNWWHCELGLITFQNEVLKYGYYRVKY
ncbi:MAG: YdcF family protein [Verrucomicrobia bacterium]|nr:YdcF family protein [Verrucomicrobiota bacterium]